MFSNTSGTWESIAERESFIVVLVAVAFKNPVIAVD
jgi:hypothetical protein